MKMKRMVSLCLSLFLLTGAAFAAETPVSPAPSYEIAPVTDQTLTRVWGTAVEVGEDQVRLNNSNEEDPLSDIILNVNEETLVLDAVTGEELSFDQVEKDDVIYAYVGAAMTMSLPPQTTAQVIIVNVPEDASAPMYVIAKEVSRDGDAVIITDQDGVKWRADADSQVSPYLTRNIVTLEDIEAGTRMIISQDSETSTSGTEKAADADAYAAKIMLFAD